MNWRNFFKLRRVCDSDSQEVEDQDYVAQKFLNTIGSFEPIWARFMHGR